MKNFLGIALILVACASARADFQSDSIKIVAFERISVPAIKRNRVAEDQSVSNQNARPAYRNLEIYFSHPPSKKLSVSYIWIGEKAYKLKTEKYTSPVIRKTSGIGLTVQTDTLFDAGMDRLWKLTPDFKNEIKGLKPPVISKDQLLLVYLRNGKRIQSPIIEIKKLSEDILQ